MRVLRLTLIGCLACAVLFLVGCSNNKGKIVGKWECVNPPSTPGQEFPPGLKIITEFTADQRVIISVAFAGQTKEVSKGTYSLGFGDNVTLDNLSPAYSGKTKTTEVITVNGNELKWKEPNQTWTVFHRATDSSDGKPGVK